MPEYWIIDSENESISVLSLCAGAYLETGVFTRGATITSPTFQDLQFSAASFLDAD